MVVGGEGGARSGARLMECRALGGWGRWGGDVVGERGRYLPALSMARWPALPAELMSSPTPLTVLQAERLRRVRETRATRARRMMWRGVAMDIDVLLCVWSVGVGIYRRAGLASRG